MKLHRTENWKDEELEEIEYEPKTVKEMLTEMKDISGLILDLAYSALVLGNLEIVDEVRYLEARMDTLNHMIRLQTMIAARMKDDAEDLVGILQVASSAEKISNAAGDIASILERIPEIKSYAVTLLKKTDEHILTLAIPDDSPMHRKTIAEFDIEKETGLRIIAIRREKRWIYGPEDDQTLFSGDMLILRGVDEGIVRLQKLAEGKLDHLR
jgi:uncharacterized protein with PhoU and TrkA domain